MKNFLRYFSLIVFSLFLTFFILNKYERYLDDEINNFTINKEIVSAYALKEKDKGVVILNKSLNNNDLIILGSSELGADVPQNIRKFFPINEFPYNTNSVGHAYAQSLVDSIRISSFDNINEDNKIALIVSFQWFMGKDIDKKGTQANLSELQFYKFMNSDKVDIKEKKYVAERLTKLLKNSQEQNRTWLYSALYQSDSVICEGILNILKPYFFIREKFLVLKDKYDAYKILKNNQNYSAEINKNDVNWQLEYLNAEKNGIEACTNNKFYVYDEYYTKYLSKDIEVLKGNSKNVELLKSKEYDDFEFLLGMFKKLNIRPYIILMSTNGYYYDYIGIDKEKRYSVYDKLVEIINNYGFDYLDLRDKEYVPYFYKDVMHFGWKGWLYVDEQITKYYK